MNTYELSGTTFLQSTDANDFAETFQRLVKEGHEYIPHSCTLSMYGTGKRAEFKRTTGEVADENPSGEVQLNREGNLPDSTSTALEGSSPASEELTEDKSDLLQSIEDACEDLAEIRGNILPDWDLVKTFKSSETAMEAKIKLADYALTFGVTLKKNISFEKMVKKFTDKL